MEASDVLSSSGSNKLAPAILVVGGSLLAAAVYYIMGKMNESGGEEESRDAARESFDDSGSKQTQKQKERKLRTIHAELVQYLANQMTSDTDRSMKDYLSTREVISPRIYADLGGVHDIVACLLSRNEIVIGKKDGYKLLIDTLKGMEQYRLAETVEKCQNKLWNICSDESATSEQPETGISRESPEASDGTMRQATASSTTLEETLSQFSEKLETVKTQCDEELSIGRDISTTVNQQQTHLTEIKSALSGLQQDINSAKNKDDIEKALKAAKENIALMERELGFRVNQVMTLSDQLNEKDRQVRCSTDVMEHLTQQHKELLNETMKKNKERENTITPYAQILLNGKEEEIKSLEKELSKLQKKSGDYEATETEKELEIKTAELQLQVSNVQDQCRDLQTELNSKNESIECLKKEKEELRGEMRNLQDQSQDVLKQLDSKNESIECLEKEKEELRGEVRNLQDQSLDVRRQLDSKNESIECLEKEKEELRCEMATQSEEFKAELQRAKEENENLKDQSRDLLTQLDSKNGDIERFNKEQEKLTGELSNLKSQMVSKSEEFKTQLQGAKKENENLKDQSRDLGTQLDSKNESIKCLEKEKEELRGELSDLKTQLATTSEELKRIKKQSEDLKTKLDSTEKVLEKKKGQLRLLRSRDIERCRQVFTKEYGADIRSIVNLGDRFAVAHRRSWDEIGVDIYDISGVKQQTLEDNIKGLLDLAVTPDKGTLVAVCDEGRLGPYTIRQIDPVRGGIIRSTPQFQVDGGVDGFDVCDGQQFLILHGAGDKVSFVNEEGSVVLTEKVKSPSHFISCGGRHVYLTRGNQYVDVYEITEDRHLKHIATSQHFDLVLDVSATAAGEVTVTCRLERGVRWYLGRSTFKDNKFSEWKYKDVDSRYQWFVSVGGDHVVVAGNDNNGRRILRVFAEEAV